MITITSIHYSKLQNLGNYENEKLGATAIVPEGSDPLAIHAELKDWVDTQLGQAQETRDLEETLSDLKAKVSAYERLLIRARANWEEAVKVLKAHGVTPPDMGGLWVLKEGPTVEDYPPF